MSDDPLIEDFAADEDLASVLEARLAAGGARLDKALSDLFPTLSRARLQALLAEGGTLAHSDDLDYRVDVLANLPISDRAAVRFSAGYEQLAGFIDARSSVVVDADRVPVLANLSSDADEARERQGVRTSCPRAESSSRRLSCRGPDQRTGQAVPPGGLAQRTKHAGPACARRGR